MIESRVAQLERLAAGLCAESDILVEVSATNWAWNPESRTIQVARDDLHTLGPEACAGIIAHEVGHAAVSRYLLLRSSLATSFPREELTALFFNAIEDPRAETHMSRRFPGTRKWFVDADLAMNHETSRPYPRCLSFLVEAARSPRMGWSLPAPSSSLSPEVLEALRTTSPARRLYAEGFLPGAESASAAYASEVVPMLQEGSAECADPAERSIRVLAARAARHALSEILPDFVRLWGLDITYIARRLAGSSARRRAAARLLELGDPAQCMRAAVAHLVAPAPNGLPGPRSLTLAGDLLAIGIKGIGAPPLSTQTAPRRGRFPVRPDGPPLHARREREGGNSEYRAAFREVRSQVDLLSASLERILVKRTRMAERSGWATGSRLDLRKAMAFEADPRLYDELWRRKTVPDRRRVAFSLLVDLSGSMEGEKAAAALRGTIVFCETLARLSIPFAVNGFQDELIPMLGFDEAFDNRARRRIGEMPQEVKGERPEGNNRPQFNDDGPCLAEAGEQLLSTSADDRVMVVISDGSPNGVRSDPGDLVSAVRSLTDSGVLLFGVGLGPDTEHVSSFYPNSIACVPVPSFAMTIAELLEDVLHRRRVQRRVAQVAMGGADDWEIEELPF